MAEAKKVKSAFVIKRDGRQEEVHFDKISRRIEKLSYGLNRDYVDPIEVAQTVIAGLFPGITTAQLDDLASETAADLVSRHPDYAVLAARIAVSNLHKNTKKMFSEVASDLFRARNPKTDENVHLISEEVYEIIRENSERLNSALVHDRDYSFTFSGIKKLEATYLLKIDGKVVERPQHMFMRVAIGIHKKDLDAAIEMYDLMSERWISHGTPTLYASGTCRPQMASCYSLRMQEDSIDGIFETLKRCAAVSKYAGGIGLAVHCIRATGSPIAGTCGISNGLKPMLRVFNDSSRYVDQGALKRPGATAVYLEPWHVDVIHTFEMRKKAGDELERCRDLFFGLWIPDLFMKRIKNDEMWSLMCPAECPGLDECWGEEFEKLYTRYEAEGHVRKTMKARAMWEMIISAQIDTGMPYIMYKDACNRKNNQCNLGTIQCGGLRSETVQYCSKDEVAACFMACLPVNRFVTAEKTFDFVKLHKLTKMTTINLNKIIDTNYYPLPEAERSNLRHRTIGIGVQGLADAFLLMRYPFTSKQARELNIKIFETIYHAALEASCELAEQHGPYETYEGSPASKGILQYDMWGVRPSDLWDWASLKAQIAKHGLRNSLLTVQMPTASVSQILGNHEGVEPYTTNVYTRVLSNNIQTFNPHLMEDLVALGLWDDEMKLDIIVNKGSVQTLTRIPKEVRELYKTVWEMSQKDLIDMAVERAPFIDQSQAMNVFMEVPTFAKCTSMHFYGWEKGLKTGMHCLVTRPAVDAQAKFTVEKARAWEKAVRVQETKLVDSAIATSSQQRAVYTH